MLSRLKVKVTNEQRLVWAELLQWCNLLFIFCVVIQIAMASGLWVVSSGIKTFLQGHNSNVLPALLLFSSVLTICLSVVGYGGTLHIASHYADERFFAIRNLMWFELLGSILGVICMILGVTSFTIVHGDILWAAERGIKSEMSHYSSAASAKLKVDQLQTKFKCCGVTSYRDWFSIPWQKYTIKGSDDIEDSVPWSCCSPESPRPCIHFSVTQNMKHKAYSYPRDLTLHTQGCVESITKYLGHHMFYVCGGLMVFIGFTLLAISMWSRLLETAVANAYTIGDPECTTWGYFIVNFGPDIEDLYEPIESDYGTSTPHSSSYYSEEESSRTFEEEDEEDEESGVAASSLSEKVIEVTGPETPVGHSDLSTIMAIPGTTITGTTGTSATQDTSDTLTTTDSTTSSIPNNNNNYTIDGAVITSRPNRNNNKNLGLKKSASSPAPLRTKHKNYKPIRQEFGDSPIPIPPPLPEQFSENNIAGMPPIPPLPFR